MVTEVVRTVKRKGKNRSPRRKVHARQLRQGHFSTGLTGGPGRQDACGQSQAETLREQGLTQEHLSYCLLHGCEPELRTEPGPRGTFWSSPNLCHTTAHRSTHLCFGSHHILVAVAQACRIRLHMWYLWVGSDFSRPDTDSSQWCLMTVDTSTLVF